MNALGHHSLVDLHGCDEAALKDTAAIRLALLDAVRRAGGTIVTDTFHTFSPYGVSGVVVIAESHVTIHTWPEHGYAAVDVFSCGVTLDHRLIAAHVKTALAAASFSLQSHPRGALPPVAAARAS
jgi:S-adenosylmethionine decarboxylase